MTRLPKHCIDCDRLTTNSSLCPRCRALRQRTNYGNGWDVVRKQILARDNHQCQIRRPGCTGTATTVDHIVPLSQGGQRLDPSNLRAACAPCNSGKRDR